MATNQVQSASDGAADGGWRSRWTALTANLSNVDLRPTTALKRSAGLSATARVWQARIAAGSFGNSWYLLRSTK
jgi:hypothetical protein